MQFLKDCFVILVLTGLFLNIYVHIHENMLHWQAWLDVTMFLYLAYITNKDKNFLDNL